VYLVHQHESVILLEKLVIRKQFLEAGQ